MQLILINFGIYKFFTENRNLSATFFDNIFLKHQSIKGKLTVNCPDCGTEIAIDAATGSILSHKPAFEDL